jgi:hypothetical protein
MPTPAIDPETAASVLDAFVAARSADLDWMTTLLDAFARARAEHEVQE